MKQPSKTVITLISIPIVVLLFFAPNIYGYFRFKSYCASEGGLRVYEPLEKNVGWLADDYDAAHMAAQLQYVEFVRYTDKKDNKTYDLRYIGNNPQRDSSFEKLPADESKKVIYRWVNVSEFVEGELRLKRFGEKILDLNDLKVLTTYYMFSYSNLDINNTIFGAPSRSYCFNSQAGTMGEIDNWITSLNTAFKN